MFDGRFVTKSCLVTFIIPIWLLLPCLTLAAHVALIKPMRSHTCVAAWLEFAQCQAPHPLEGSGVSYGAVLSTCTTAGVKRPLILYSQHVTMCYALVSRAECSRGSIPCPVTLQYVQIIVKHLFGQCHHMVRL